MSGGVAEPGAPLPPLKRVRSSAPRTNRSEKLASQTDEGSQVVRLAVVDLFAGLRTVHVAAKLAKFIIVLSHAAENCDFASEMAKTNESLETLIKDRRNMDDAWGTAFVDEVVASSVEAILVIGGFPRKGLSKARGASRENLEHKDSIFFFYSPASWKWLERQQPVKSLPVSSPRKS